MDPRISQDVFATSLRKYNAGNTADMATSDECSKQPLTVVFRAARIYHSRFGIFVVILGREKCRINMIAPEHHNRAKEDSPDPAVQTWNMDKGT